MNMKPITEPIQCNATKGWQASFWQDAVFEGVNNSEMHFISATGRKITLKIKEGSEPPPEIKVGEEYRLKFIFDGDAYTIEFHNIPVS